jgi:hypothetical protein
MILGVNFIGVLSALYYCKTFADNAKNFSEFRINALKFAIAIYTPLLIVQYYTVYEDAILFMGYYASATSVVLFGSPLVNA